MAHVSGERKKHHTRITSASAGTRDGIALSTASKRPAGKTRSRLSKISSGFVRSWMLLASPRELLEGIDTEITNRVLERKIFGQSTPR